MLALTFKLYIYVTFIQVSLAASNENYFAMEAICLCTIFYLCLCTYYTVFNIRVLNYYYLAGKHQSDE